MDNGLQQSFVAEHDGGAPSVGNALGCEPLADISRLDVLGGGGDEGDVAWRQLVSVLIEDGLACLVEATEEGLFYLMEVVEADEYVGIVFELNGLVGGHLSVEGALVGELLAGEALVVVAVDVADVAPQAQESFLEFGVVVVGEVAEEASYHLALFVGEV